MKGIGPVVASLAMVATALASLAFAGLDAEPGVGRISESTDLSFKGITFIAQLLALVTVPIGIVCAASFGFGPPSRRLQRWLVSLLAALAVVTCLAAVVGTGLIALLSSIQIDGCANNGCPNMGIAQRAASTVAVGALVTGAMAALILWWSVRSPTPDGRLVMPTARRVAGQVAGTLPGETQRIIREFASQEASLAPAARAEVARAIATRVRPLIPESSAQPDDLEFVHGLAAALPDTQVHSAR